MINLFLRYVRLKKNIRSANALRMFFLTLIIICASKVFSQIYLNDYFSYKGNVQFSVNHVNRGHINDIKNCGDIYEGKFYFTLQSEKDLAYKILKINLNNLKVDTLVLDTTLYSKKAKKERPISLFKNISSISISGDILCLLFNRLGKKQVFLQVYKKHKSIYQLDTIIKLEELYDFVKVKNNKAILVACYNYKPHQRDRQTELFVLNLKNGCKIKRYPEISYVESSHIMPFHTIDVSSKKIIWGHPDTYNFTIYNSTNLDSVTTHTVIDKWRSIDLSVIQGLRKNVSLHPKRLIDTLLKINTKSGKAGYYRFINERQMLVSYTIYDSSSHNRVNYFDVWFVNKTRAAKLSKNKLLLKPLGANEIVNRINYPMNIDKEFFFTGDNFLITISLSTPVSLIGKTMNTYNKESEDYLLSGDLKMNINIYNYK
jgi:hypothetical protein